MKVSIVVPTFNEEKNIIQLLREIKDVVKSDYEVIVVDDGDDDTAILASQFGAVVYFGQHQGLGDAILHGIQLAKGQCVVVMDADLSHKPSDVPRLLEPITSGKYDMAIGSRYVKGGDIAKWDRRRGLSSKISASIMYPVFGVRDANSGFFAFRKSILNGIKFKPTSWKMMMEVMVKSGAKKLEVPIAFGDRKFGKSKNNFKQKLIQAKHMFYLVVYKCRRYISFALVGGLGNIPHFLILWLLTNYGHVYYIWSNIIAIMVAGTQNYTINHILTFRKDRANNRNWFYGWTKFLVVMVIVDFGIQTGVAFLLTQYLHIFYILSVFISTIIVGLLKFLVVKRIIWGKRNETSKINNSELA